MFINSGAKTLNELILNTCQAKKDGVFLTYEENNYTYFDLKSHVVRYTSALIKHSVQKKDHVAIILDNKPEYFYSFFSILFAGGSVISISPKSNVDRITQIIEHSDSRYAIMEEDLANNKELISALDKINCVVLSINTLNTSPADESLSLIGLPQPNPDDIAFFQYTSGTTGFSKGVMMSHKAVLANLEAIGTRCRIDPDKDVFTSMMPLYHDMGLVGFGLFPIYSGNRLVLFRQDIKNLYNWLGSFKKYHATISGASNTLLYLTRRVVSDPGEYDLSTLRVMLCGSEPLFPQTLTNFESDYKIRNCLVPAYGLAETTLCATMGEPGAEIVIDSNNIVSCGKPLQDVLIRIDSQNNSAGEVWIKSPSLMNGYYKNQDGTGEVLVDGYLKTGDLGYFGNNGDLYIIGRKKNIIIRDGVNLSPGELEEVSLRCPDVRNACVIGIPDPQNNNREEIYLIAETKKSNMEDVGCLKGIYQNIKDLSKKFCHYQAEKVIFVPPATIPFSPNGKMQHLKMKELVTTGELMKKKAVLL